MQYTEQPPKDFKIKIKFPFSKNLQMANYTILISSSQHL